MGRTGIRSRTGGVDITAISTAVRSNAPWIERVEIAQTEDGYVLRLHPDPLLIKARALQQGRDDDSIRAAVRDVRFQRATEEAVARVKSSFVAEQHVLRHEIVVE
jgi:hypothetical protein